MNLLFSTEYEINISIDPEVCSHLRRRVMEKKQHASIHHPAPSRIVLSIQDADWMLRHEYLRRDILAHSLMYRQRSPELQFFKSITFKCGEQAEVRKDEDAQLLLSLPPEQWSYFIDALLCFAEGYWNFFLVLPQLQPTITFASHGHAHNDLSLLIDREIAPPLPYRSGVIQALLASARC